MSIRLANRTHTIRVAQSAAGYLQLAPPKAGFIPRVVAYDLNGGGATFKFQSDDGAVQADLSGAISPKALAGAIESPVFNGAVNLGLGILSSGGGLTGYVTITQESKS